ncbi:MAG: DUF6110 family protein [Clostridiales bacterium]|jgi:hypothetical protein|nr:DUF6110 family protein [Clostridiales bacterium]
MQLPNKTGVLTFVGGAFEAIVGGAFVKSKAAHKLAVKGVVGSLRLKDDAVRKFETIREEAQDVYEEAKREADSCKCDANTDTNTDADEK